jgi:hypothetical protein
MKLKRVLVRALLWRYTQELEGMVAMVWLLHATLQAADSKFAFY